MPAPANTFVMRDSSIEVEGVEYANQFWRSRLVPSVNTISQQTLVPDGTIVDVDNPVWTWEITFAQVNKTGGLAKLLRDMDPGDAVDVVYQPHGAANAVVGEPTATFTVKAMPPAFGGTAGALADNEMVLPVVGAPVFGVTA
jgi:hypothetical protein